MVKITLVAGCLLGNAWPSWAQEPAPAPVPRYYVGAALFSSDFQALRGGYANTAAVPVQLTVGYQLRPRLAVQVGAAYSQSQGSYFDAGRYYYYGSATPGAYYYAYYGSSRSRTLSVAPLLRHTLTRQLRHRFQADLLVGLTFVAERYDYATTRLDSDSTNTLLATTHDEAHDHHYDLLLSAGVSTRYRLSRHLEALLDITLHRSLADTYRSAYLAGGLALGARYRFGGLR